MTTDLRSIIASRPVLLDGAIGTMLAPDTPPSDKSVTNLHNEYLLSGADIITTHTFCAQYLSQPDTTFRINLAAARTARTCADTFSSHAHPRFVAGSVGPSSLSLSTGADATESLTQAYFHQIRGLIRGGADIILIETITDPLNARAAIEAFLHACDMEGHTPHLMLSFAICRGGCTLAGGHTLQQALDIIDTPVCLISLGVNCSTSMQYNIEALQYLSSVFPDKYRSICPNAGLPRPDGSYALEPQQFAREMIELSRTGLAHIIGGCCGTTPAHIKALHDIMST